MTNPSLIVCAIGAMISIFLPTAAAQNSKTSANGAASSHEHLQRLFRDEFAWRMREFPEWAMQRGDYSHADRITDSSLSAIERRQRESIEFLDRLQAIPREGLDDSDKLSASI